MLTFLVCAVAGLQASAGPPPLPFTGGDVADFVATYARRYHRPVCVGTSEGRIAAFDVRARTFEELDRKIATRIGAETRGPGAFATLAYPRDFFMTGRSSAPKAPKEITSKDGEVTFESKDPLVLVLGSLSSLKWSKPFEIHWFLSPTKLVAMLGSENMAEKEFLELVANAAGGELVESKDRYFVDLPLQRHKELWASYVEGMATRQTPPPRDAARFRFGAAVVRQTPLKTLREATANPDSSSLVTLAPLDHAVDLAREYVSRELSYLAGEVSKGDSGALSKIEFFQRINWLNQVRAVLRAHGTVGCLVRLDDGALVAF